MDVPDIPDECLLDTPEAAAMVDFPPQYCRVVASLAHDDDAYVLLDTGPPGQPYLYGVHCSRHRDRWVGGGSANGPGWGQAGPDPSLGTLVAWGLAPEGADAMRFEFDGTTTEVPVSGIAYLAAWWRVPCPEFAWPTVEGVRVGGRWTRTREP